MSSAEVLAILRRNSNASVRDVPALKQLLRELLEYNKKPLVSKPTFGASVHVVGTGSAKQRAFKDIDLRIPLQLWPAVFPWESCRGFSHTPRNVLRPLAMEEDAANKNRQEGQPLQAPAGHVSILSNSKLNPGMLFVQSSVDYRRPVAFWSGGITTGLDVAFLQAYRDPSFTQRLMTLVKAEDGPPRKLHIDDVGQLAPFSDSKGPHHVQSNCTGVEMVLEMREGWFAEIFKALATHHNEPLTSLPDCRMTLELSKDMHTELLTKGQMFSEYINGIDLHVDEAIRSCNKPATASGAGQHEKGDTTFKGTPNDSTAGRPSAADSSKYPRSSVDIPQLPKLDYELVSLGYQLGLGMSAIAQCSNRMASEVQNMSGDIEQADIAMLHDLATDAAIDLYPPALVQMVLARHQEGKKE